MYSTINAGQGILVALNGRAVAAKPLTFHMDDALQELCERNAYLTCGGHLSVLASNYLGPHRFQHYPMQRNYSTR